MSYLKDREIWLSNVPTGNPPTGYFWKFIQNGKVVVRDSSGNNQIMVATSGSQAITGSLTVTGGITGTVSSASYVEYSNVANKPALVSGSSQVTYSGLSGIPSGIVSGSSQVTYSGLSGIPSGIVSGSAQVAALGFATTGSNTFQANQVITGSLFITQNLVVAGSSSIQYISSSVLDIADNIITVNAFNPGVRFGGLAVIDSGSSPQVSGSILFDSIRDQWIFVHQNQSVVTSSVLLMGPETYNDLGNETYLSANRLPKGSGVEHLRDSNITDTGTVVSINSNTAVTGSFTVVTGSAVELQVTNTGVNIGSALTDSHIISGSLRVNPNGLFVSGSGNVGINTSSPSARLHVIGGGTTTSISNVTTTVTNRIDMANPAITLGFGYVASDIPMIQSLNNGTNSSTALTINPFGGNVGIGTASPSTLLHVSGSSASIGRIVSTFALSSGFSDVVQILNPNQTGGGLSFNIGKAESTRNLGKIVYAHSSDGSTSNRLAFGFYDADNLLNLTAGGNVGIGTTSPSEKLDVIGGGLAAGNGTIRTGITYSSIGLMGTFTNHDLGILTNGTERMRISSTGAATFSSTVTSTGFIISADQQYRMNGYNSGFSYITTNAGFNGNYNGVGIFSNATNANSLPAWALDLGGLDGPTIGGVTDGFTISRKASGGSWASRFVINSTGNVGIGTNNPDAIFHIARANSGGVGGQVVIDNPASSALGNTSEISFLTDAGASGAGTRNARILAVNENVGNGAANMQFHTWDGSASAERMRITSTGTVGIGVTPSSNWGGRSVLQLGSFGTSLSGFNGGGGATQLMHNAIANSFNFTYLNNGGATSQYMDGLDIVWGNAPVGTAGSAITFSERMRISSGGNVGIGITSPSARLQVRGANELSTFFDAQNEGAAGATFARVGNSFPFNHYTFANGTVYIGTSSNPLSNATPLLGIVAGSGTDVINIRHNQNGNNAVNIWQTGTSSFAALTFYKGDAQGGGVGNIICTTSGTTYNTTSDYRLKTNIAPIENGIDRLMQLKPSKFNWIETGNEAEGFIAHELQEIFPDAVTGEKDAIYSSTGNIKPQSVDYGRITPLLVKAIQEQQTLIESLKSRIEILEQ